MHEIRQASNLSASMIMIIFMRKPRGERKFKMSKIKMDSIIFYEKDCCPFNYR
jgi:hypothetical protein